MFSCLGFKLLTSKVRGEYVTHHNTKALSVNYKNIFIKILIFMTISSQLSNLFHSFTDFYIIYFKELPLSFGEFRISWQILYFLL